MHRSESQDRKSRKSVLVWLPSHQNQNSNCNHENSKAKVKLKSQTVKISGKIADNFYDSICNEQKFLQEHKLFSRLFPEQPSKNSQSTENNCHHYISISCYFQSSRRIHSDSPFCFSWIYYSKINFKKERTKRTVSEIQTQSHICLKATAFPFSGKKADLQIPYTIFR